MHPPGPVSAKHLIALLRTELRWMDAVPDANIPFAARDNIRSVDRVWNRGPAFVGNKSR